MTGTIAALTCFAQKGKQGEKVTKALLVENLGMEGNRHQGGEKQLSLSTVEAIGLIEAQEPKGLCFKRFSANILFKGIETQLLQKDDKIACGSAQLMITSSEKHCHEECPLFSAKTPCPLTNAVKYARVSKGGTVSVGDVVQIVK